MQLEACSGRVLQPSGLEVLHHSWVTGLRDLLCLTSTTLLPLQDALALWLVEE